MEQVTERCTKTRRHAIYSDVHLSCIMAGHMLVYTLSSVADQYPISTRSVPLTELLFTVLDYTSPVDFVTM